MKKILCFCLVCLIFSGFAISSSAASDKLSNEKQYYKIVVDDNDSVQLQQISESEYLMATMTRSAHYAEGWVVTSVTGTTVAYLTLHYQTTVSAGKKVFDLSTAYFEANPQNGYAGHWDYLSSSVHSINVKYTYANLLGDNGYRTHRFYPQQ